MGCFGIGSSWNLANNRGIPSRAIGITRSHALNDYERGPIGTQWNRGVAIITNGVNSAHTIDAAGDRKKLGRFNWITVQGRDQQSATLISVYRPREEQVTAANQLAKIRQTITGDLVALQPQLLWEKDLEELVGGKRGEVNQVIIAGDYNDNLNDDDSRINNLRREWGLRNLMREHIGDRPATYHRGRDTIDGVFGTDGLELDQCRYSSFVESPGDHRWHF